MTSTAKNRGRGSLSGITMSSNIGINGTAISIDIILYINTAISRKRNVVSNINLNYTPLFDFSLDNLLLNAV